MFNENHMCVTFSTTLVLQINMVESEGHPDSPDGSGTHSEIHMQMKGCIFSHCCKKNKKHDTNIMD